MNIKININFVSFDLRPNVANKFGFNIKIFHYLSVCLFVIGYRKAPLFCILRRFFGWRSMWVLAALHPRLSRKFKAVLMLLKIFLKRGIVLFGSGLNFKLILRFEKKVDLPKAYRRPGRDLVFILQMSFHGFKLLS